MLLYWILLPIVWPLLHILWRIEVVGKENNADAAEHVHALIRRIVNNAAWHHVGIGVAGNQESTAF